MSDDMVRRAAELIDWHFTDSDEESGCALRCGHHSDESEQSRAEHIAQALADAGLLVTPEHDRAVTMKALRDVATKRWVCGVVRSGYHNGAGCSPEDPHRGWGCGYYYEYRIRADRIEKGARDA